ncbi:hypothetical protein MKW94_007125 [Papaver nudicaule]|uniref:CST complex subunit STN1 n=1 Tax=Papaver nudicaule TaxID=74823 RepID=A0AA41VSH2_PAPNU|nr:hypothetical protein [Papaver nudicaule]
MDPVKNSHAKLLAFDILSLSRRNISSPSSSSNAVVFYRKSRQICRVETLGVVVTREFKAGKSLKFLIDDGTGCVSCILWLNQLTSSHFSRKNPDDVRILAEIADNHSSKIQIGRLARVRGRVTFYRGKIEITVTDVVIERDPNAEILHWLDCVKLARDCYDVVVAPNIQ